MQAQHTAANSKAIYPAGLPGVEAQALLPAAYIDTWHIIIASPPDAAGLAPHTAAYIDIWHIIIVSP